MARMFAGDPKLDYMSGTLTGDPKLDGLLKMTNTVLDKIKNKNH